MCVCVPHSVRALAAHIQLLTNTTSPVASEFISRNSEVHNQNILGAGLVCTTKCCRPELFALLASGADLGQKIPKQRFDVDSLNESAFELYAKGGYFMMGDAPGLFDNRCFRISPSEAAVLDPHQRLTLSHVYHSFTACGISKADIKGSATGVFIGVMTSTDWTAASDSAVSNTSRALNYSVMTLYIQFQCVSESLSH